MFFDSKKLSCYLSTLHSTGADSPVTDDYSTFNPLQIINLKSAGILSPVSIFTKSPTTNS